MKTQQILNHQLYWEAADRQEYTLAWVRCPSGSWDADFIDKLVTDRKAARLERSLDDPADSATVTSTTRCWQIGTHTVWEPTRWPSGSPDADFIDKLVTNRKAARLESSLDDPADPKALTPGIGHLVHQGGGRQEVQQVVQAQILRVAYCISRQIQDRATGSPLPHPHLIVAPRRPAQ